jgi:hypothetical protein
MKNPFKLNRDLVFKKKQPFTKFCFFIIKIADEKKDKIFFVNVGSGDPGVDCAVVFYQLLYNIPGTPGNW